MLEAVNADIALIPAPAAQGAAEVGEDGGALMPVVLAPQPFLRRQKRVAAAGIDDVARLNVVIAAVVAVHFEPRFTCTVLLHLDHFMAFARVRAALAGVVVEHLVEILAPYLVGVRRTLADGA